MTDPRIQARRVDVERERGRRRLRRVIVVLCAAAVVAGGVVVLYSPVLAAREIVIAGNVHTTRTEVLDITGLVRRPPLIEVDTSTEVRRLERLSWVKSARVTLQWPSTVSIAIVERLPVAVVAASGGGFALVDATGRVLAEAPRRPTTLPLVTGVALAGRPGSVLAPTSIGALHAAAALPVSLLGRLMSVSPSPSDGVVLHLRPDLQVVVGGAAALGEKYVSLATVLERVNLSGVATIDLRVPSTPVLTPLPAGRRVHAKGSG